MARPIWKGHISFGLVNIPITLYSGERSTDLHFRMLDSRMIYTCGYWRTATTLEEAQEAPAPLGAVADSFGLHVTMVILGIAPVFALPAVLSFPPQNRR